MMTINDVMTVDVATVHPETPLKEVVRILVERRISGVVVVDDTDRILGIVSEADLLIKEQGAEALPRRRAERLLGSSRERKAGLAKVGATTAGEAMTSPAVTIARDRSLAAAAALMTDLRINRLPVAEVGRLVGIVSRADLIRAYVRSDRQIADTITDDLLLRELLVDPAAFDVVVTNGVVQIRGHAETRSLARTIEKLVRAQPGVIAVEADISWAYDDRSIRAADRDLVTPSGTMQH